MYDLAIKIDPEDANIYGNKGLKYFFNLATSLYELKQYQEAKANF